MPAEFSLVNGFIRYCEICNIIGINEQICSHSSRNEILYIDTIDHANLSLDYDLNTVSISLYNKYNLTGGTNNLKIQPKAIEKFKYKKALPSTIDNFLLLLLRLDTSGASPNYYKTIPLYLMYERRMFSVDTLSIYDIEINNRFLRCINPKEEFNSKKSDTSKIPSSLCSAQNKFDEKYKKIVSAIYFNAPNASEILIGTLKKEIATIKFGILNNKQLLADNIKNKTKLDLYVKYFGRLGIDILNINNKKIFKPGTLDI